MNILSNLVIVNPVFPIRDPDTYLNSSFYYALIS